MEKQSNCSIKGKCLKKLDTAIKQGVHRLQHRYLMGRSFSEHALKKHIPSLSKVYTKVDSFTEPGVYKSRFLHWLRFIKKGDSFNEQGLIQSRCLHWEWFIIM